MPYLYNLWILLSLIIDKRTAQRPFRAAVLANEATEIGLLRDVQLNHLRTGTALYLYVVHSVLKRTTINLQ